MSLISSEKAPSVQEKPSLTQVQTCYIQPPAVGGRGCYLVILGVFVGKGEVFKMSGIEFAAFLGDVSQG